MKKVTPKSLSFIMGNTRWRLAWQKRQWNYGIALGQGIKRIQKQNSYSSYYRENNKTRNGTPMSWVWDAVGCTAESVTSLLQLFLGKDYHRFTAAAKSEENSPPAVTNTENGCLISTEIDVRVVYENDAVNKLGNRSEKYYLPQILQDHVNKRLASSIDFSNDRFVIKDEETMIKRRQRSDKKRKIAMLSST